MDGLRDKHKKQKYKTTRRTTEFLIPVGRVFLIITQNRRLINKTTIRNNLCSHMLENRSEKKKQICSKQRGTDSLFTLELSVLLAFFSL